MNPTYKTMCTITVIMIAGTMMGCIDSGYGQSDAQAYTNDASYRHRPHDVPTSCPISLNTQHVSGIEVTTTLNNVGTLYVSGIDNTVTVTNDNVERVYLSGVDNVVYIPASSKPYISQSGIDCVVKRYG